MCVIDPDISMINGEVLLTGFFNFSFANVDFKSLLLLYTSELV